MKTTICPECGTKIDEGATKCPACDTVLVNQEAAKLNERIEHQFQQENKKSQVTNYWKALGENYSFARRLACITAV